MTGLVGSGVGGLQGREDGTGKGRRVWPSGEPGRRRNSPAFWKDREAQWAGEVFGYRSLLARREPPPGAGSAKPSSMKKLRVFLQLYPVWGSGEKKQNGTGTSRPQR